MKSRNVTTSDFLDVLQKEYICALIRSKIYPRIGDKKYYKKVCEGKKNKIEDIAERNGIPTIIDNKEVYNKYWHEIVGNFGYPNFIYNEKYSKNNEMFPFIGTIVEVSDIDADFKYGITDKVDFKNKTVHVSPQEGGKSQQFSYLDVRKLTMKETDKMFYYYPNNQFKFKIDREIEIGTLINFDYLNNLAYICHEGKKIGYPHLPDKISRVM